MNESPASAAAVNDVFVFPASFSQERLWLLEQFAPGTPVYNVAGATPLAGWLNVGALERSLNEIVRRHEALRTTFATVDGRPVQVIAPSLQLKLPVIDLQHLPAPECEVEAERLAAVESRLPFDLARGPLLRATLIRRNHDHLLVLAMHHIVSDGWSVGIFFRELTTLYDAFATGQPSPLAELPIQYADFAEWQRQRLQGESLEKLLAYWKQQLQGAPAVLELPTDRPHPAIQSFRGAIEPFSLRPSVVAELKMLTRFENATLFMALLGAFQVLLHRYTGLDDIVVGSPIANRNRPEIENIIGFFVNTLMLRTNLSGDPTFREVLQHVREVTLGAYSHQDLPFEKLVEELKPERRLNHNPLFQVMFVFQNTPMPDQPAPDQASPDISTGTAKFDLTMFMMETEAGLSGLIEYNTDIFDDTTIKRVAAHFCRLLEAMAQTPDRRISELRLLSDNDERQLVIEWNQTDREFADACVHQLFEARAQRSPQAVAAVFEDQQLTYEQLDRRANQLSNRLRAAGVSADVAVGICVDRSLDMLVAVLGILKAGGAFLPLDPNFPPDRLALILKDARASVVVADRAMADRLPEFDGAVVHPDDAGAESDARPDVKVSADNVAYIIYTSGSTGSPKGIAMTHKSLANLVLWQTADSSAMRTLQFAPLSFDVSCQEIFATWASGGTLILLTEEDRIDPVKLLNTIVDTKVERLFLPPVALQQFAETAIDVDLIPAGIREVIAAGEQLRISPAIARLFSKLGNCTLNNQYGPTETHVVSEFVLSGSTDGWRSLPPIGRPIANAKLYVLDRHMRPAPIGVPGALYVAGTCLARGYLNRPDLTAEKFVPNPFSEEPGARMYSTGDLARYRQDRNIDFLGRADRQVKVRGFRIEPGEIEALLVQHPKVRQAVVLACELTPGDKRLVSYLVTRTADAPTRDELRDFLKTKLPEHMVPASFVVLESLPLTPNGKVDYGALPTPASSREMTSQLVAPRSPAEVELAEIWSEVLGVDRIGIHDDFFNLGGHSLLATQVISRMRSAFKVDLPLRKFFEAPTIAKLALVVIQSQIESGGERAAQILARLEAEPQLPVSS